jgi:hypothetical protein
MKHAVKRNKPMTRIAIFFIAVSFVILCSRNNPLDPNAGNYAPGTNLLVDPGFETGDAAWLGHASGGRSIVNTGAQSGTFCEQMVLSPYPRNVFQDVSVSAGKVYGVSGWIKTLNVATSAHILVLWYTSATPDPFDASLIKADTLGSFSGTHEWSRLSRNYYAPASALTAQLYLECVPTIDTTGRAWFDNLSFNAH